MKRKLFIILLILPLLLVGCKKNKSTKLPVENQNTKTTEVTNNKEGEDKTNAEGTTNTKNGENPDGTDLENTEAEGQEATAPEATAKAYNKEFLKSLCDDSSYISRVRINQDSAEGYTASFVVDYKGDLSQVEMTIPKTLKSGREYIIFYKDDENGKIVPARSEDSFIEIMSSEDKSLNYVENRYRREEKQADTTIEDTTNDKNWGQNEK